MPNENQKLIDLDYHVYNNKYDKLTNYIFRRNIGIQQHLLVTICYGDKVKAAIFKYAALYNLKTKYIKVKELVFIKSFLETDTKEAFYEWDKKSIIPESYLNSISSRIVQLLNNNWEHYYHLNKSAFHIDLNKTDNKFDINFKIFDMLDKKHEERRIDPGMTIVNDNGVLKAIIKVKKAPKIEIL